MTALVCQAEIPCIGRLEPQNVCCTEVGCRTRTRSIHGCLINGIKSQHFLLLVGSLALQLLEDSQFLARFVHLPFFLVQTEKQVMSVLSTGVRGHYRLEPFHRLVRLCLAAISLGKVEL